VPFRQKPASRKSSNWWGLGFTGEVGWGTRCGANLRKRVDTEGPKQRGGEDTTEGGKLGREEGREKQRLRDLPKGGYSLAVVNAVTAVCKEPRMVEGEP